MVLFGIRKVIQSLCCHVFNGDTLEVRSPLWDREGLGITEEIHKTHGLKGSLELPDWPPLTLPEVGAVLRRFPQAGGAVRLLSFSPRPFSAASMVATPFGKVFVKRHHCAVRDREGLQEEHRFIAHLAASLNGSMSKLSGEVDGLDAGSNLMQPVFADLEGNTAVAVGDWIYEVHPLAVGVDLYEDALSWTPFLSSSHARAAGRALARLHRAAENYDAPARMTQQLITSFSIFAGGDPLEQMDAYLKKRPLLREYVEQRDWRGSFDELMLPLFANLAPWISGLRPLWTHNDFHASNLTWSEPIEAPEIGETHSRVLGVIDFGLADRTNLVHDIATAIERNIVEWLRMEDSEADIVHLDHLDALLAGYEELSPLSHEEARALVAMLPLVHCEFALSETDYFLSVLRSEDKAYLAYEGYFLAHSRWFHSLEGRRLLAHLAQWAEDKSRIRSRAEVAENCETRP